MLKVLRLSFESFLFALQAIVVNRLRTLLSLLGITIGIFAIIAVFTIVDSLEMNIRESISTLGSDIIYIQKWPWTEAEGTEYKWWQYVNRPVPHLDEFEALKEKSRYAQGICFVISPQANVRYQDKQLDEIAINGVSEGFDDIRHFDIRLGRYFSAFEMKSGRNLAIIGDEVASELFSNSNPLGKSISIRGYKTEVLGVLAKEGKDNFGNSMDESIILPINHVRNLVNIRSESMNPMIWVKARDGITNQQLKDELRMHMRSIRRLKPTADDDFALNETSMLSKQLDQFFGTLNFAGWFIGIFSLLVGGFGIANIMFVSVRERTHLIGIQKALGAKKYFILLEFMFESVLLAIAGGLIGLLLVFGGTLIINNLTEFTIQLTMGNIIMGLTISSVIGLLSGLAPAWSASQLAPVDAINTTF